MEYKDIKKLIDDMGDSKLNSLDIEFPDGVKISMTKEDTNKQTIIQNQNLEETKKIEQYKKLEKQEEEKNKQKTITSPMVGTFYIKPSPDSRPYVEIGKEIKKGDTVCIIEAMKLMNEIESEYDGKIKEILIKDGEVVEYGKPLFLID